MMNRSEKALVTKELQKAAASLSNAFRIVVTNDESTVLMKRIKEHQKAIGELIVSFNGGSAISIGELVH